jgi:hypothetical protein
VLVVAGLTARWSAEVLQRQAGTAHLIEVAARQRMLTQRIETGVSGLADPSLSTPVRAQVRAELTLSADELDRISHAVQYGDPGLRLARPQSTVFRDLYASSGLDLAARIASYADAARAAARAPSPLPRSAPISQKIHSEAARCC